MKEKTLALLAIIFIAMSITGFTYAQWNDTITISNTMTFGNWFEVNMGFVEPLDCTEYHIDPVTNELNEGEYLGKEVGECECHYAEPAPGIIANEILVINITNAYPSYEVHCNYTLKNIGTKPLHINETVISDPNNVLTWNSTLNALVDADNNPIINITTIPSLVCTTLQPGDEAKFEMTIHITDNAQECHTYTFQAKIRYEEAT